MCMCLIRGGVSGEGGEWMSGSVCLCCVCGRLWSVCVVVVVLGWALPFLCEHEECWTCVCVLVAVVWVV